MTLDRTDDIFLDTVLLSDAILLEKIKNNVNNVKISIVLSSFRSRDNLISVLTDFEAQTFKNFEIVIVDDLTTSDIEEVVNNYILKTNINYVKKQLGSASSAKNLALSYTKGEYIIFVEEGSTLRPYYLELFKNAIQNDSYDVVSIFSENNHLNIASSEISGDDYLAKEILKYKNNIETDLTGYMFRKKFLDVYNISFNNDLLILENLYFKLETLAQAKKMYNISKIGYKKTKHKKTQRNSAMVSTTQKRVIDFTQKVEVISNNFPTHLTELVKLLCGYLLIEALALDEDMNNNFELTNYIKSKLNYFDRDSFFRKNLVKISPVLFAKYITNKESDN